MIFLCCGPLNAFDICLFDGFGEGCNDVIKALRRVVCSFRTFLPFRTGISLPFNPCSNV